jgi:hypothetical protein
MGQPKSRAASSACRSSRHPVPTRNTLGRASRSALADVRSVRATWTSRLAIARAARRRPLPHARAGGSRVRRGKKPARSATTRSPPPGPRDARRGRRAPRRGGRHRGSGGRAASPPAPSATATRRASRPGPRSRSKTRPSTRAPRPSARATPPSAPRPPTRAPTAPSSAPNASKSARARAAPSSSATSNAYVRTFDARLAAQQERAPTADVAGEPPQAALDADRELRALLDSQLKDSQKRLAAAEKARDAAIAAVEQAARGRTTRRGPGASGRQPGGNGASLPYFRLRHAAPARRGCGHPCQITQAAERVSDE